jgi:hypothetical protein
MVTAAFTIFFGLEALFIRFLAIGCAGGSASPRNLDFCAAHNILSCIAQGRPEEGRLNRQGNREMTQTYEDFSKYGKEFADTGLKSFASLSKGAQAIATEAGEYTKKSFETGSATVEKLFSAKSLEKAIEIQSDYAKQSYEAFVAEATKIGDLYAELAKEAYKPFESIVAKAK